MASGSNHKGAIRRSMVAWKLSAGFGFDPTVFVVEGINAKPESVAREQVAALESPLGRMKTPHHTKARDRGTNRCRVPARSIRLASNGLCKGAPSSAGRKAFKDSYHEGPDLAGGHVNGDLVLINPWQGSCNFHQAILAGTLSFPKIANQIPPARRTGTAVAWCDQRDAASTDWDCHFKPEPREPEQ